MANPSTVNATAAGKEVIRRFYVDGLAETATVVLQGAADHIMTTISIMISNRSGNTDDKFHMIFTPDGGSDLYMLTDEPFPSQKTFIFNEKVAITGTDVIKIQGVSASSTCEMDVWCTYIDQHF